MRLYPVSIDSLSGGDTLLQAPFWARFKARFGWEPWTFSPDPPGGEGERALLVLRRPFLGPLGMAYIPYPPAWAEDQLPELSRELLGEMPLGTFFLRYDLSREIPEAGDSDQPQNRGLRKAPMDIQPPSTVILDLQPPEEELLAGMKSKTRYNIRLSGRKGVAVEQLGSEGLDCFYQLYQETAERDRIAIHSREYYQGLLEEARVGGADIRIYAARHGGETLAAVVTVFQGDTAVYLYGASSSRKRNLMPAYALQWQAIRDAKSAGCRVYDFFGIPPDGQDRDHPMHGLYRFKTGFGGRIVHRRGSWDYPFSRLLYGLYRAAEAIRVYYYKVWKKRG